MAHPREGFPIPAPDEGPDSSFGPGLEGPSLVRMLNLALLYRRLLISVPVALGLALVLWLWVRPDTYTSQASFMPQTRRTAQSGLSGLAAQLGVIVPTDEGAQSPAFYVELLESREILRAVVETPYVLYTGSTAPGANLTELYEVEGKTDEQRRERAVDRLLGDVSVSRGRETGVVRISVQARWAPVAEQIVRRMLELVNEFNLEKRQSQAASERRFAEQRLEEVRQELRQAEDRLQTFLQRNREVTNSPVLRFEQDRLSREVGMRQQLYTTLAQAYEQARMDEVRDIPVITVVEQPSTPVRADRKRYLANGMTAFVLGGIIAVFVAFGWHAVRKSRDERPEEFQRFLKLRRALLDDLLNRWRGVSRSGPRSSDKA